ncbi:MAG: signal peptidase II [Sandaracinus sp.]
MSRPARVALALGVSGFVLFLDSVSKAWAESALPGGARVLVPDVLELTYAENPGVAFSMFAEAPSLVRLGILPALALSAALLFFWHATGARGSVVARIGAALVVGGALGNLLDRLRLGYVIDFVHAHAGTQLDYPVFNVADIAVFVGIAALLVDASRRRARQPAPQDAS